MTNATYRRLEVVVKWTAIALAWIAWIAAVFARSFILFALGFLPYLLVYNWMVRGILQSRVAATDKLTR